jgi:hypothetical protein
MKDVELVLRFFALREPENMDLAYKDYLSTYMGYRNEEYKRTPSLEQADETVFGRAVENCLKVFGKGAFERRSNTKSAPLADAVMTSLSLLKSDQIDANAIASIKSEFRNLLQDPAFVKAISSGTNGKGAIRTRIEMARAAVLRAVPQTTLL